jgi:hypothetical protein
MTGAMTDIAISLIAVCAIAFGCCFVRLGRYALLSQFRFIQFCTDKANEEFHAGLELSSFGEPVDLRLLGLGLIAFGLFIVVSVASFLLIRIGHLT